MDSHSVPQTLYTPKFLMPDLLAYLNLSFLIHIRASRINTLFSELDHPSMIQTDFLQMYSLLPYVCWLVMWRTFSLFRVFGNILLCLQNIVCSGEAVWVSKDCSHHPDLYKWTVNYKCRYIIVTEYWIIIVRSTASSRSSSFHTNTLNKLLLWDEEECASQTRVRGVSWIPLNVHS